MTAIVSTRGEQSTAFREKLAQWTPDIEKAVYRGFTPDRLYAAAVLAAVNEPKIFQATPTSLYLALMRCARWGLDIGDTVHLVPLNKKVSQRGQPEKYVVTVEAWPDYKGLKALAIRQGIVRGMEEFCVYAGDTFNYQLGLDAFLQHQPKAVAARGRIVGAYTIVRLPHHDKTFLYMPIEDIEAIRANSRQWGPTKVRDCPPWYAMKTVVRNYLNRQPKQGALSEALAADDTEDEATTAYDPATGEVLEPGQLAAGEQATDDRAIDAEILAREGGA